MKTRLIALIIIGVVLFGSFSFVYALMYDCLNPPMWMKGPPTGFDRCWKLFVNGYLPDYSDDKENYENKQLQKLSWCADRFDQTKHEFHQSLEGYTCDTPICPESEPPLFSSALNDDEEFIEKRCAKFVDKWAYMTEDNDYTWHYVNWESFVKHHYESDPLLDPQRNEKCADLFDLIMRSAEDSDLWYELTETNDFRDAKCASIVEDWEHLTEHDVWNIGISWDALVTHELYGCAENEIYYYGICITLETKERAESIGGIENEN